MNAKKKVIAIDGPAGAGKSTVAKLAAERLGYTYLDTGAMYRAVTWQALENAAEENSELTDALIESTVANIDVNLRYDEKARETIVSVNGVVVTDYIRSPEISRNVSQVAKVLSVRVKMVELQRQMAANGGVIMDGRDIGTNVLPNAEVKIFLTASIDERAERRYAELKQKGYDVNLAGLKAEIAARDKADSERAIAPLIKADDAVILDTTGLSIEEVVQRVLELSK